MSAEPQTRPQVTEATKGLTGPPEQPHHFRHMLGVTVVVVALFVGFVSDTKEVLKKLSPGASAVAAQIPGMFSIPTQIFDEFKACNYNYLFFCELKPGVAKCPSRADNESAWELCVAVVASPDFGAPAVAPSWWQSIPVVNLAAYAAVMLPRLPDAIFQMLKLRWSQGPLEFQQGLLFLLAYVTLIVVALRGEPGQKIWFFIVTLVYGPYLVIGLFWLLQHALAGASPSTTMHTGEATYGVGTTTCLAICAWHDLKSIGEELKLFVKRVV